MPNVMKKNGWDCWRNSVDTETMSSRRDVCYIMRKASGWEGDYAQKWSHKDSSRGTGAPTPCCHFVTHVRVACTAMTSCLVKRKLI